MSEMEWEGAPDVRVPRVRNWFGPACADWKRGCYPRRGLFVAWGWLIPLWGIWSLFKLAIYLGGLVVMLLACLPWIAAELLTYRRRYKREALRVWQAYLELYHKEPPPQAA